MKRFDLQVSKTVSVTASKLEVGGVNISSPEVVLLVCREEGTEPFVILRLLIYPLKSLAI